MTDYDFIDTDADELADEQQQIEILDDENNVYGKPPQSVDGPDYQYKKKDSVEDSGSNFGKVAGSSTNNNSIVKRLISGIKNWF